MRQFQRLRTAMFDAGITQAAMADTIGLSRQTLQVKLRGETDWRLSECYKILQVLNLDQSRLTELFPEGGN